MGEHERRQGAESASEPGAGAVGLMADSHGDAGLIRRAARLLAAKGCRRFYHLGDVCDSLMPQTAEACLDALRQERVTAVRGNNEQALAAALRGAAGAEGTVARLARLPLAIELEGALLVHSLPFTRELGPASLIGALGPAEARRFFADFRHPLLFRGHGHSPQIVFRRGGRVDARLLEAGETVVLAGRLPCIVTCGALADGHCMVWQPALRRVQSLRLDSCAAGIGCGVPGPDARC